MVAFSSAFDPSSVEFLESLKVPIDKVASFEITDIRLLRTIGATRKPVIVSTGMASLSEIERAVATLRESGSPDIVLLKCTSSYPADPADSDLLTIPHMQDLFGCDVGLSDHTLGIGAAVAGVTLGAVLIEKHVTLDRKDGGVDAEFSLEPAELSMLVNEVKTAWRAKGGISYGVSPGEKDSQRYRRSLYFDADMDSGDVITPEKIKSLRPVVGIPADGIDQVVGRTLARAVSLGEPVTWELLK